MCGEFSLVGPLLVMYTHKFTGRRTQAHDYKLAMYNIPTAKRLRSHLDVAGLWACAVSPVGVYLLSLGGMALSTLRAKTVRTRTEERAPPRGKNECRYTRRH